jgi:hypothetical protein
MSAQNEKEPPGMVKQLLERIPAWAVVYVVVFFPTVSTLYYMAQGAGWVPDMHREILAETKAQSLAFQKSQESTEQQIKALTRLARGFCFKAAQSQEERLSCIEE